MYRVRNKTKAPVPLIVRSFSNRRNHSRAFTCLNIPGNKIQDIHDDRIIEEYLMMLTKENLLSYEFVVDSSPSNLQEI